MTTRCQFPSLPKTVKTYKSQRSAKIAWTKAKKAYDLAVYNRCTGEAHEKPVLGSDQWNILHARIREYITQTFKNMEATRRAIEEQGFLVY